MSPPVTKPHPCNGPGCTKPAKVNLTTPGRRSEYCSRECKLARKRIVALDRYHRKYSPTAQANQPIPSINGRPPEVQLVCAKCGDPFLTDKRSHKRCANCRDSARAVAVFNPAEYPCAGCAHGIPSVVSETKWECGITRAADCRPWGYAALKTQKEAQRAG